MATDFSKYKPRRNIFQRTSTLGKIIPAIGAIELLTNNKFGDDDEDEEEKKRKEEEAKRKMLERFQEPSDPESFKYKIPDALYNALEKYQKGISAVEEGAVKQQEKVLSTDLLPDFFKDIGTFPTKATAFGLKKAPELILGTPEQYREEKRIETEGTPEERAQFEQDRMMQTAMGLAMSSTAPQTGPAPKTGVGKAAINSSKKRLRKQGFSNFDDAASMKGQFRKKVKELHPDVGGDPSKFKQFMDDWETVTSAKPPGKSQSALDDLMGWVDDLWKKVTEPSAKPSEGAITKADIPQIPSAAKQIIKNIATEEAAKGQGFTTTSKAYNSLPTKFKKEFDLQEVLDDVITEKTLSARGYTQKSPSEMTRGEIEAELKELYAQDALEPADRQRVSELIKVWGEPVEPEAGGTVVEEGETQLTEAEIEPKTEGATPAENIQSQEPVETTPKIPVKQIQVGGEGTNLVMGQTDTAKGEVGLTNLSDNKTLLHEVAHIKVSEMSDEKADRILTAAGEFLESNPEIVPNLTQKLRSYSWKDGDEEWLGVLAEEYPRLKNEQGKAFTDKINDVENGQELSKTLKEIVGDAANRTERITTPSKSVEETAPSEVDKGTKDTAPEQPKETTPQGGQESEISSSSSGGSSESNVALVDKVVKAIRRAQKMTPKQRKLYREERGKRFEAAEKAGVQSEGGEGGYYAQLEQLKGELPKAEFESIRGDLTQKDRDGLFDMIMDHPYLIYHEKLTAQRGLNKLLGEKGAGTPQPGELKILEEVYGARFIKAVKEMDQSKSAKVQRVVVEVLALPRALMAGGFDMAFGLRQGIFAGYAHPKMWSKSFKNQFKYFVSDDALKERMMAIRSHPYYKLAVEYNLPLTDLSSTLSDREEIFMSTYAERIPLVKISVKASARAFVGFANELRFDLFKHYVEIGKETGDIDDPHYMKSVVSFIGNATGRGELRIPIIDQDIEAAGKTFSIALFSLRLFASRINLLDLVYYAKLHPEVRKRALRGLLAFLGGGATMLAIADILGAEVEKDPTSSDFAKIKVGNVRIDPWGGFQQPIVLLARLWTGKLTSSTTGGTITFGEGYRPLTRADAIINFLTYKEAPVFSFLHGLMRGRTPIGEDFKVGPEIVKRVTALFLQDAYELLTEADARYLPFLIPGFFGVGIQAYGVNTNRLVGTADKLELEIKNLRDKGRYAEAEELRLRNSVLFEVADSIRGMDERKKELEKRIELIEEDPDIGEDEKEEYIGDLETTIIELEQNMKDVRYEIEQEAKIPSELIKGSVPEDTGTERTAPKRDFSRYTPRINP